MIISVKYNFFNYLHALPIIDRRVIKIKHRNYFGIIYLQIRPNWLLIQNDSDVFPAKDEERNRRRNGKQCNIYKYQHRPEVRLKKFHKFARESNNS